MKKITFLSMGQWAYGSKVRTAADMLRQSIHLPVAAEELGADGAYFRIHHFARQLASPLPLLAAIGAKTSRIEIGTAVRPGCCPSSRTRRGCSSASGGAPAPGGRPGRHPGSVGAPRWSSLGLPLAGLLNNAGLMPTRPGRSDLVAQH